MSRSYKKTPYCGDKKNKFFKRYANKKIRNTPIDKDIFQSKGSGYKKKFESWEICDYYYIYWTYQWWLNHGYKLKDTPKEYKRYMKYCVRK